MSDYASSKAAQDPNGPSPAPCLRALADASFLLGQPPRGAAQAAGDPETEDVQLAAEVSNFARTFMFFPGFTLPASSTINHPLPSGKVLDWPLQDQNHSQRDP